MFAEPDLADGFLYLRKLTLQLASKMRFVAAQFDAYLSDELWRAQRRPRQRDGGAPARRGRGHRRRSASPVAAQANVVFATLPAEAIAPLQDEFAFYTWDERAGEVRWMCSWDTDRIRRRRVRRRDPAPAHAPLTALVPPSELRRGRRGRVAAGVPA